MEGTDRYIHERFSKTLWWSKWEVIRQVMNQFGDVLPFLQQNQDIGPSLRQNCLILASTLILFHCLKLRWQLWLMLENILSNLHIN